MLCLRQNRAKRGRTRSFATFAKPPASPLFAYMALGAKEGCLEKNCEFRAPTVSFNLGRDSLGRVRRFFCVSGGPMVRPRFWAEPVPDGDALLSVPDFGCCRSWLFGCLSGKNNMRIVGLGVSACNPLVCNYVLLRRGTSVPVFAFFWQPL
jgi:hypothetical protein